jgi:hypothetical protein
VENHLTSCRGVHSLIDKGVKMVAEIRGSDDGECIAGNEIQSDTPDVSSSESI